LAIAQLDSTLEPPWALASVSLARSIVTMHGGEIEAGSEGLGQGSHFNVQLPLTLPRRSFTITQRPAHPRVPDILVVDDSVGRRDQFAMICNCGYDAFTADQVRGSPVSGGKTPDLILLDLGMPHEWLRGGARPRKPWGPM
jgi:hypothetical protein